MAAVVRLVPVSVCGPQTDILGRQTAGAAEATVTLFSLPHTHTLTKSLAAADPAETKSWR